MELLNLFFLLGIPAAAMGDTFLYFGYGSNLLAQRIHVNNPTAVRKSIGKLEDFRLDFDFWADSWNGTVATIVPDKGSTVWGAVWEIDSANLEDLDRQEGVDEGMYFVHYVDVVTPEDDVLYNCRTYQLTHTPAAINEGELLPEDRRPSKTYLGVIIQGAIESELPSSYIEELKLIPDNGRTSQFPTKTP